MKKFEQKNMWPHFFVKNSTSWMGVGGYKKPFTVIQTDLKNR